VYKIVERWSFRWHAGLGYALGKPGIYDLGQTFNLTNVAQVSANNLATLVGRCVNIVTTL